MPRIEHNSAYKEQSAKPQKGVAKYFLFLFWGGLASLDSY